MIGYLQGKIIDTDGKKAILLTEGGVGHEIHYAYHLEKETTKSLFIHHHISENDQSLWGFNSLEDKKMFELLKTVNKVGSSKAYPLITMVGTAGIIQAIRFDRSEILVEAQGIGKKMAEQIILTLKDKIDKFESVHLQKNSQSDDGQMPILEGQSLVHGNIDETVFQDVLSALGSLGYTDKNISKLVLSQLEQGHNKSEEIIKNVLREL